MQRSAAEGYQQASLSEQKVDGEDFIQTDVCPKAGDVILDLGCGTGELSAYLAELVGPRGKVIGVDPDKERIRVAKESHSQIENLSFTEGSAASFFRMDSNSYDIVFCNAALHWMPEKQQVFNGMFSSLKDGGKIAVNYLDRPPPFEFNAYMLLNPGNGERICHEMYQCESKTKIEHYCLSSGFQIVKHYEFCVPFVFNSIESLLKWHWSVTHGVLDLSLVIEERLKKYLSPYVGENGKPCLDFRGIKEESTVCRLIAAKQAENAG